VHFHGVMSSQDDVDIVIERGPVIEHERPPESLQPVARSKVS
jgi:hypothetical protein